MRLMYVVHVSNAVRAIRSHLRDRTSVHIIVLYLNLTKSGIAHISARLTMLEIMFFRQAEVAAMFHETHGCPSPIRMQSASNYLEAVQESCSKVPRNHGCAVHTQSVGDVHLCAHLMLDETTLASCYSCSGPRKTYHEYKMSSRNTDLIFLYPNSAPPWIVHQENGLCSIQFAHWFLFTSFRFNQASIIDLIALPRVKTSSGRLFHYG